MIALDASALLAFLFREPGHDTVATALKESCASTVNLSEVLGRFSRDGHSSLQVLARLQATAVQWVDFDPRQAALAADMVPHTRRMGLSLGDRACLALAITQGCPAMTGDSAWAALDVGVEVVLIR